KSLVRLHDINQALARSARRPGSGERLGDALLKRVARSSFEALGPRLASPERLGKRLFKSLLKGKRGTAISHRRKRILQKTTMTTAREDRPIAYTKWRPYLIDQRVVMRGKYPRLKCS
ncbi:hypothetical protein B296_00041921, partial [Ensete ventricosum]